LIKYTHVSTAYEVASMPNDTYFSDQGFLNYDQNENDIDAPEAWEIETGDSTIVVAIIDTGVDTDHPDLTNNVITSLSSDFVDNYDTQVGQYRNHGTKVAGIVAADMNNSTGVASVAGGRD
jgi:thermitase